MYGVGRKGPGCAAERKTFMAAKLKLEEMDFRSQFSVGQLRALAYKAISGDDRRSSAASFAGVSERTIYHWLDDATFRQAWDNAAEWAKGEIRAKRLSAEIVSLETLVDVQTNPEATNADKISAAKGALTAVQRAREHDEAPRQAAITEVMKAAMLEGLKEFGHLLPKGVVDGQLIGNVVDTDGAVE
jgi:hypothetical protein